MRKKRDSHELIISIFDAVLAKGEYTSLAALAV